MRFDMHCHTKEGSIDGKINLADYIGHLKEKGYQGMLITDHNSYNAYRYYKRHCDEEVFKDFTVLKGIEYDTIDAGHILIIMPEYCKLPIMELRGLPVLALIEIVHFFGGILGPAHPCGEKYLSLCNTKRYRKNPDILKSFDFIEIFNACETPFTNNTARNLAIKYNLPGFGGSDSHKTDCIGLGYTDLPDTIYTETDLINCVRAKQGINSYGSYYHGTTKEKIGSLNNILVYSFWFYNKAAGLFRYHKRRLEVVNYKKVHSNVS